MVALVKRTLEADATCAVDTEETAIAGRVTYSTSDVGSGAAAGNAPELSLTETRDTHGRTEPIHYRSRFEPTTEAEPAVIGARHREMDSLVATCSELVSRICEAENIIERENLYQMFNQHLVSLFELRSSRERAFGHLMILLLGVTQNTTSEFFAEKQFSALDRAIKLARKPTLGELDLKEAERLLAAANFDMFRPLRGVFDSENV